MFTLKSPLKYYPITVGSTKLLFNEKTNEFILRDKNESWMGYDQNTFWQSTEFFLELKLAYGVCITTGLGLGIIQTHLVNNPNVTKVIVYEQNPDVIEIFSKIIEYNNFDISKIEIRNENANDIKDQICDCLFPDHFSNETEKQIVEVVRNLSHNNIAKLVWYWPAGNHFIKFALKKQMLINNDSYELWKKYTGIRNLPDRLDEEDISLHEELKVRYKTQVTSRLQQDILNLEERNKLLDLMKKVKQGERK